MAIRNRPPSDDHLTLTRRRLMIPNATLEPPKAGDASTGCGSAADPDRPSRCVNVDRHSYP
eukprot:380225-Rhodomonas_salina.1